MVLAVRLNQGQGAEAINDGLSVIGAVEPLQ